MHCIWKLILLQPDNANTLHLETDLLQLENVNALHLEIDLLQLDNANAHRVRGGGGK